MTIPADLPRPSALESPLTPAKIAATDKVRDVKISPDGARVVYQVQPFYKAGAHTTATLWTAETERADSARALTSGTFHDNAAVFHPDGARVVFLSDRQEHGGAMQIYATGLGGEDAVLLVSRGSTRPVTGFDISPDGKHIAFMSADEPDEDEVAGPSGTKPPARLRLYSFSTGDVWTVNVRRDTQVESFAWSPDGTEIIYRLQGQGEVLLEKIAISEGSTQVVSLGSYLRCPSSRSIWTASGNIVEVQSFEPRLTSDAKAIFTHQPTASFAKTARLYGEEEDAIRIVDLRSDDMVAVEIATGVDSRIDVVSGGRKVTTIFETDSDAIWFGAWDARRLMDGSFVVAVVLSSAIKHLAPNVWTQRTASDGTAQAKTKLSSHLEWLDAIPSFRTEVMKWKAPDGTELDGMLRYPASNPQPTAPLPTVMMIHGGPYRRDIPDLMPYFCNWRELLACAGYLVISPNYRGSQGRGHAFACAEHTPSGSRLDWADCESMVDEVVRRGLADPTRLGVAGWSHGGYLAAWGVTQTKNLFKAAVVGAAVSGWATKAAEVGAVRSEESLYKKSPVIVQEQDNPVRHTQDVETAVLILHGEKDKRVPVGEAIDFMDALEKRGKNQENSQLVIYPREPHGFADRKNAEDVLERVLEHFDCWL